MTALVWDAVGERRYEAGVDHGVLYHPDNYAVPWNGLTSISEVLGREVKSYFIDGVKYLDYQVIGAYQATLKAFTYPDSLNDLIGDPEFAPGVFLHDQRSKAFGLSYRTRLSDDLDPDTHYRIHLIYNVLATPSNTQFDTRSDGNNLAPMEWTLNGAPPAATGIRPTSHISISSRNIDPTLLATLEGHLYGGEFEDPYLPTPSALIAMVDEFYAG